jgi:hypothetical protein
MFFCEMVVEIVRLCDVVVRVPATDSKVWVQFPEQPDFLRSSGSRTGSTQLREYY